MRPLRFLFSLATCILAFLFLLFIGPWRASTQDSLEHRSAIRSYLHWRTPSSLFPPSALITLVEDNSTYFFARPAAFGPLLPAKSLAGQLWIGSGFGEDRLGRSGAAEGELGCSDVPGWGAGSYSGGGKSLSDAKGSWASSSSGANRNQKRSESSTSDDGTDDYLHHPLPASDGLKSSSTSRKVTHADIQSLQESAEIADKVVLLSRGGCGFLEKVKWVQRRGGRALIVGDDIRGEPLVTMYARGDTSNVTIPSLFVSYTTAHLLSVLIPSGSLVSGLTSEEAARLGLTVGSKAVAAKIVEEIDAAADDKPTFTTSTALAKPTPTSKKNAQAQGNRDSASSESSEDAARSSWLGSIFGKKTGERQQAENQRPPGSGDMGWVLQEEFDDDLPGLEGVVKQFTSSTTTISAAPAKTPESQPGDFVIGVQDWRDPDLVAYQKEQPMPSSSTSTESAKAAIATAVLKGGSITPGSGEYAKAIHEAVDVSDTASYGQSASAIDESNASSGWLGRLFGSNGEELASDSALNDDFNGILAKARHGAHHSGHSEMHEGLWVTLTPTSMSSSPFFDTLLVLVVSPLVTLTIVYALLLLRSRIRRRRWRAPKSVVERLPVRTYQTCSSTGTPSSTTSSISTPITATTPLLPANARPINARPRPRSRTTSEVPVQQSVSLNSDSSAPPSLDQIEEKRAAGLAEWRRRYGGKQRECVVCLEEYIDGVSRVMSLPCGHEFHVECITPWLTTRRRTCPICKGDVVRSLAQSNNTTNTDRNYTTHNNYSSSSSPPVAETLPSVVEHADDIQEQAALSRNDDRAAARPLLGTSLREEEAFEEDLERGIEERERRGR